MVIRPYWGFDIVITSPGPTSQPDSSIAIAQSASREELWKSSLHNSAERSRGELGQQAQRTRPLRHERRGSLWSSGSTPKSRTVQLMFQITRQLGRLSTRRSCPMAPMALVMPDRALVIELLVAIAIRVPNRGTVERGHPTVRK